jgi:hypothetical protein
MKQKLIVGGCSITHGAETVDGFMHPENVLNSYSYHLSKILDYELINLALSGCCNDDIFHSLIKQIDSVAPEQIGCVMAAWTAPNRLHWINKGRHWFFIPGWASSMEDLYNCTFHQHPTNSAFITGDSDQILETLYNLHKFFIDNYLDDSNTSNEKLSNYKSALRSHCENKKIKLIQFNIFDYCSGPGHPTIQQHIELADKFNKDFFYKIR